MHDFFQLLGKVFSRNLKNKGAKPVAKKDKPSKKDRLTELEEMLAAQAENIKKLTQEVSALKRDAALLARMQTSSKLLKANKEYNHGRSSS